MNKIEANARLEVHNLSAILYLHPRVFQRLVKYLDSNKLTVTLRIGGCK